MSLEGLNSSLAQSDCQPRGCQPEMVNVTFFEKFQIFVKNLVFEP